MKTPNRRVERKKETQGDPIYLDQLSWWEGHCNEIDISFTSAFFRKKNCLVLNIWLLCIHKTFISQKILQSILLRFCKPGLIWTFSRYFYYCEFYSNWNKPSICVSKRIYCNKNVGLATRANFNLLRRALALLLMFFGFLRPMVLFSSNPGKLKKKIYIKKSLTKI